MAYREPGRTSLPPSPDVDESLFAPKWWQSLLVSWPVWGGIVLLVMWVLEGPIKVNGVARPATLTEKIVVTVLVVGFQLVLLGYRARSRKKDKVTIARLTGVPENVRVASPDEDMVESEDESADAMRKRR